MAEQEVVTKLTTKQYEELGEKIIVRFRGVRGNSGTGYTGYTGAPGQRGDTGYTGQPGVPGQKGEIGYTGAPGRRGDTGYTGSTGSKGDTGAPGRDGLIGSIGVTGAPGRDGLTGSTGATGQKGDTGAPGPGAPLIVTSNTLYVDAQFFATHPERQSMGHKFSSITAAILAANDNDIIHICPGVYYEDGFGSQVPLPSPLTLYFDPEAYLVANEEDIFTLQNKQKLTILGFGTLYGNGHSITHITSGYCGKLIFNATFGCYFDNKHKSSSSEDGAPKLAVSKIPLNIFSLVAPSFGCCTLTAKPESVDYLFFAQGANYVARFNCICNSKSAQPILYKAQSDTGELSFNCNHIEVDYKLPIQILGGISKIKISSYNSTAITPAITFESGNHICNIKQINAKDTAILVNHDPNQQIIFTGNSITVQNEDDINIGISLQAFYNNMYNINNKLHFTVKEIMADIGVKVNGYFNVLFDINNNHARLTSLALNLDAKHKIDDFSILNTTSNADKMQNNLVIVYNGLTMTNTMARGTAITVNNKISERQIFATINVVKVSGFHTGVFVNGANLQGTIHSLTDFEQGVLISGANKIVNTCNLTLNVVNSQKRMVNNIITALRLQDLDNDTIHNIFINTNTITLSSVLGKSRPLLITSDAEDNGKNSTLHLYAQHIQSDSGCKFDNYQGGAECSFGSYEVLDDANIICTKRCTGAKIQLMGKYINYNNCYIQTDVDLYLINLICIKNNKALVEAIEADFVKIHVYGKAFEPVATYIEQILN